MAACSPSVAPAQPLKPDAPKLILAISVDQFSADLFDEYRGQFTGGLKRLIDGGTVFHNGYQSHAATETCPGHSTIMTSKRPGSNGIIANTWVDWGAPRADKTVYCAEDESVPGSTSTAYTVSVKHLNATTLGDRLKAVSPASRNVAVAGKDRAAIMMGGHNLDQRWYRQGTAFATDLKGVTVPRSVTSTNQALTNAIAQARPALDPPAFCQARDKAYQVSPTLSVGTWRMDRAAGDASSFFRTPEFDGAVLALSAALIQEMQLGKGPATDVMSVGLSATDYVGHAFGRGGMEMCLQMAALDRDLGDFLALMDRSGIDYAIVLTADHGGLDIPERLRDHGVADAARADPGLDAAEVGKQLAPRLGLTGTVLKGLGIAGDIWVDASVPEAKKAEVIKAAEERYQAHPQVYGVYTKAEILALPMPSGSPVSWTVPQRIRASYDATRSGDLYVALKPNISAVAKPSVGYTATHGSPWDYDRRVPIIFWRKGAAPAAPEQPVETVDIMPTLAAMIGLPVAKGSIDGKCLAAAGARCPR
nr:alkaline phosphatase family protein [Sphingomonas alba]